MFLPRAARAIVPTEEYTAWLAQIELCTEQHQLEDVRQIIRDGSPTLTAGQRKALVRKATQRIAQLAMLDWGKRNNL